MTKSATQPTARALRSVCPFQELPTELRLKIYRLLLIPQGTWYMNPWRRERSYAEKPVNGLICIAILLLNKGIYHEAMDLLYGELPIAIEQGHILKGDQQLDSLGTLNPPTPLWRHDPHLGVGYTNEKNIQIYSTPEKKGKMEPHVFARFKKVELLIDDVEIGDSRVMYKLQLNRPDEIRRLNVKSEGPINDSTDPREMKFLGEPDSIRDLGTFLKHTNVFKDLTSVILKMPGTRKLKATLGIAVDAHYVGTAGLKYDTKEECDIALKYAVRIMASQVFVKCGIMDPLRTLANVEKFDFDPGMMWVEGWQQWVEAKLEPDAQSIIEEIESKMKANCEAALKADEHLKDQTDLSLEMAGLSLTTEKTRSSSGLRSG